MSPLQARTRFMILSMVLLPILLNVSQPRSAIAQDNPPDSVATISGNMSITSPLFLKLSTEPYVGLFDMTAFVKRDLDMPPPFPDQPIAGVKGDLAKGATYALPLPVEPRGVLNDVSNGQGKGKGVGLFEVGFAFNVWGDPFQGPGEMSGWPNQITSLLYDPGTQEVTGGKMLVWAPDAQEMFPTEFGPDGKLFTKDDPVASIPAGWTVVDLDSKPFKQIRAHEVDVPIIEGNDALVDLSKLSYTEAFDALVKDLRVRYVFTVYKKIDWDAIVKEIRPKVVDAQAKHDQEAFNVALVEFTTKFHDGHFSTDVPGSYYGPLVTGGVGLLLDQADDGTVIVQRVLDNSVAAKAGIKAGAKITAWNDQPIDQALANTDTLFDSQSSPHGIQRARLTLITRATVGTKFKITYQNPGDSQPATIELTAVRDREGYLAAFGQDTATDPIESPVTAKVLPSGIGYIKVNTFDEDSILMTHAWDWDLQKMQALNVPALIVDIRGNYGGLNLTPLYLAGSFYDKPFVLVEDWRADKNGKFIYSGHEEIEPSPMQWTKPVAVVISAECYSACEIFVAAMAHDPQHFIVGRYPTAGVEAGIGFFKLPGDISLQAPVDQLRYPETGEIFLEGVGVPPNVKVPATAETLLSKDDQELAATEKILLKAR